MPYSIVVEVVLEFVGWVLTPVVRPQSFQVFWFQVRTVDNVDFVDFLARLSFCQLVKRFRARKSFGLLFHCVNESPLRVVIYENNEVASASQRERF